MSDIRLKTLTVEDISLNASERLTIKNGNVIIMNTTVSTNVLNGSFISSGGISINCTYDSISSTSGGAVTIGGGLAVHNQTFLGNNLILDSNASIIKVKGINEYRFFLDTVNNKNCYISPDGISKRFDLYDTYLNINVTTISTNSSTGGLIINGGISINSTANAINSSNGGALTVAGGIAIGGDSYLSNSLIIGKSLVIKYTGNDQISLQNNLNTSKATLNMNNNDLVISNTYNTIFNTTFGNFIFRNFSSGNTLFTVTSNYSQFDKYVNINDTVESLNSTTASLLIMGGLSVNCSTDASSGTNGGAVTINGGLSIKKKTFINDSLAIELSNNYKNNKLILYQINNDITETNRFTGIGVTNGSLRFQVQDLNNDYIFYSSLSSGNASNEVFRIKGTNEVQFIGFQQKYSIKAGGATVNDLSIQGQRVATASSVGFYTNDGDTFDNNDMKIFGLGLPNNIVNSEYLKIGWENTNYVISVNNNGQGINRSLVLQSNQAQLSFITNGSIICTSSIASINSSTGSFILYGGLSVNNTNDCTSLTNGGCITLNGGISIKKSAYIGNTLNIYSTNGNIQLSSNNTAGDFLISNPTNNFIFAGNNSTQKYKGSLSLFTLNNNLNYEVLSLNISNTSSNAFYNINTQAGGVGIIRPLQINVGLNAGLYLNTTGQIGINNTIPAYDLDINGTIKGNNYNYFNQLTIYNTADATNISTSGSLSVLGGASIQKKLYVGGDTYLLSTTNSSSSSAALYITGGLTISSTQNSINSSGALTVNGGGYFGGSVYIRQDINISGNITGPITGSNSFGYITITGTNNAINNSTGCLITLGGITINSSQNSQNTSNGGSFLTNGGASISKDLYLGGDLNNYGVVNFYNTVNNLVKFYDISNVLSFSFDRNTSSSDFSISRYDLLGNFIEKSLSVSRSNGMIIINNTTESLNNTTGSIITNGGITVKCTTAATSLNNGGACSIYGGASINKNVFVGGDTVFSSTTVSTNSIQGAVIVAGGVGIAGNININGNAVITGNLSIMGTTTNINTTNTLITDNVLILNSGPAGSSNAALMIQRYQTNNDIGTGDVVTSQSNYNYTLPNQSGMSSTQIKLSVAANVVDGYYNGWWVKVLSGFSSGQVRQITGYVGSTRIATLNLAWTTQNPSIGDSVNLYDRSFVGLIWDELNDVFILGSTAQNPTTNLIVTGYSSIYADSSILYSSINSTSSSIGALVVTGGVGINETTDAISTTSGSALTVAGGASIKKSLYVGNTIYINGVDIKPNTYDLNRTTIFNAANNVTLASITNLSFDNTVWGIDIYISIQLIASNNLYSNYQLKAVNKGSTWEIINNYVGDQIVVFSITNSGQIQYTSTNYIGFVSLTFKFKCVTN